MVGLQYIQMCALIAILVVPKKYHNHITLTNSWSVAPIKTMSLS